MDLHDSTVTVSSHLSLISSPTVVKTTDTQLLGSYAPPEMLHSKTYKEAKCSKAVESSGEGTAVEGSVPAEELVLAC